MTMKRINQHQMGRDRDARPMSQEENAKNRPVSPLVREPVAQRVALLKFIPALSVARIRLF